MDSSFGAWSRSPWGNGLSAKRLAFPRQRWDRDAESSFGGRPFPLPMVRIEADLLIPGRGEPIRNGCVVFDGPTISFAGPIESAPKAPPGASVERVPVVLPGLWDCHGHLMGLPSANVEDIAKTSLIAIKGMVATKFKEGPEDIDIRVRLREVDRENNESVRQLALRSPRGQMVSLNDVAQILPGTGASESVVALSVQS